MGPSCWAALQVYCTSVNIVWQWYLYREDHQIVNYLPVPPIVLSTGNPNWPSPSCILHCPVFPWLSFESQMHYLVLTLSVTRSRMKHLGHCEMHLSQQSAHFFLVDPASELQVLSDEVATLGEVSPVYDFWNTQCPCICAPRLHDACQCSSSLNGSGTSDFTAL